MVRQSKKPEKLLGPGQCNLCERAKLSKNICISGSGPRSPELVVIAESPSTQEDIWCRQCRRTKTPVCEKESHQIGENLVGPAWRLLQKALLEAGFNPELVWKANSVSCSGGTPHMKHARICKIYWMDELAKLDYSTCKAVVVLGEFALRAVTDNGHAKIREARLRRLNAWGPAAPPELNRPKLVPDSVLLTATYHPSAALPHHDAGKYEEIVSDLLNIHRQRAPVKPEIVVEKASCLPKTPDLLAIDAEWRTDSSLRMIGISDGTVNYTTQDIGGVLKWIDSR